MGWNQILDQTINPSGDVVVFDSRALSSGTYATSISWPGGCGGVIQAILVALRGNPSLIQKASNNSGTISAASWTIAFPANNTAGNALILDISFAAGSFTAGPVTVSDSRGNTWTQAASGNPAFQGDFLQTWVAYPCASGANTVTISIGGSFPFTNITAAVLEYRGVTGTVDGAQYGCGVTFGVGSPIDLSVTVPGGDLLHLVTSNTANCGAVSLTGGGYSACIEAWLSINEPRSSAPVGGKFYPSVTARVFAHNFDGVWTWDGISIGVGDQRVGVSQAYTGSQDMLGGIVALRGPAPAFVQGSGSASAANVDAATFTQAYGSNNTAGNCLVVDVFGLLDVPDTFAISDSQGNSWTQVYFENTGRFGGGDCWTTFVALNCTAGANTVTITVNGIGSNKAEDWAIAVHEYSGISTVGAVDSFGVDHVLAQTNSSAINLDVTTTGTAELVHVAVFTHQYNTGTVTTVAPSPAGPGGWVDQSARLHLAEALTFSYIVKQRGTAKIPLYIEADDAYEPTIGSQVCLWDITDNASFEVFSGTIDDWEIKWLGQEGDRTIELTCVSFESIFDEIRVPAMSFIDQTAGFIFTALFALASGSPLALGTVGAGATISSFLVSDYPTITDLFNKLATLSEYVWGVDPGTAEVYFTLPDVTPSPFTLDSEDVLWEQFTLKEERHDYRNRQIFKVNSNAAVQSSEYFVGSGQLSFTLLRPVDQVTAAWVTQNIQNSATGTFTGQPSPGDTISFSYASGGGGGYGWVANNTYFVGAIVIDPSGNVQRATIAGSGTQSGPTMPTWKENYGDITTDFTMSWTCEGPAGFGSSVAAIYTFVTALDNTQFGQVLIGSILAATIVNLANAINSIQAQAGITFSLPTWENPLVNADQPPGSSTIVVRNKPAGAAFVAGLSWTGSSFSFNKAVTFGGVTTFGTITVNVGVQGQTSGGSGPTLVYTPGSNVVSLATPLNSGSNLQVQYLAQNAGYIQVENTADVIARAAIEQSTGKYQQSSSDDNALTLVEGLQTAQQQLAAYGVIPATFEFTTFIPGLYVGQVLAISMTEPSGPGGMAALVNGNWFIREINAELVPVFDGPDQSNTAFLPRAGHYRYTVQCINVTQIGDWLDFWEGLSGGGGGAGGGSALYPGGGSIGPSPSASSGGYSAAITAVGGTPLAVTHGLNTTSVIAVAYDSSGNQMSFGALTVTSANVVTVTFGISFTGTIVIMGVA